MIEQIVKNGLLLWRKMSIISSNTESEAFNRILRIDTAFKIRELLKAYLWLVKFPMDLLHAKYTDEIQTQPDNHSQTVLVLCCLQ